MYGCFSHKLTAVLISCCSIIIVTLLTVLQKMLTTYQVQLQFLSKMKKITVHNTFFLSTCTGCTLTISDFAALYIILMYSLLMCLSMVSPTPILGLALGLHWAVSLSFLPQLLREVGHCHMLSTCSIKKKHGSWKEFPCSAWRVQLYN